jgi:hypothetical protein
MQELQRAYAEFLEHFPFPSNGVVEIWTEVGCEKLFQFQEIYLIKLAEMMVKCGQYAELPHHDKVTIGHFSAREKSTNHGEV